ncbi:MAG: glycosyltransferase [Cyanobacteria bacterium J06598_3]
MINSILRNASYSAGHDSAGHDSAGNDSAGSVPLRFNIVVPAGDRTFFTQKIQAAFAADSGLEVSPEIATFRIREFTPPDYLKHYLDNKFKEKKTERRISRYMQYARLFLKEIFPDVSRVIYLDGDTLMLDDVRSLFAQGAQLTPQRYLAAVPQFFPAVFYFSNPFKMWSDLRRFKSSFNSGVLLTDLSFWTAKTYDSLRHYLALDAKNNYRLYHLGDETIFNLMFKESYIPLATKWNSCGYGQPHWISRLLKKDLKKISVIHWSGGHHKPWQSHRVIYSAIWRSYAPGESRSVSPVSTATPAGAAAS